MNIKTKQNKNSKYTKKHSKSVKIDKSLHSRLVALDVLLDIFKDKTPLELAFNKYSREKELNSQEKSFSFALINFVLRKCIAIDAVIEKNMDKPYPLDSMERQILRVGLAQLFFMDSVEEFACIHTSVELAKVKAPNHTRVVNAVLREAQRSGFEFLEENYELMYEVPKWISEELKKDYPQKAASIKSAMIKQGNIHVRLRNRAAANFLKENARMVKYLPGAWVLKDGVSVNRIPKLDELSVYVQDIGSQLVGHILSQKIEKDGNLEKPIKILDLCAAPGGKTIHLLDLLPYAQIIACDNNQNRLKLLENNLNTACESEKDRFSVVLNDALNSEFEKESFDYILLDAPCSGLGISRKHVDVLHIKEKEELENIKKIQAEIIPKAFQLLKEGGTMMYSTCSILKDEGERQIDKFISENKKAVIENIEPIFDSVGKVSNQGTFRTFQTEEMDAFFMALINKK